MQASLSLSGLVCGPFFIHNLLSTYLMQDQALDAAEYLKMNNTCGPQRARNFRTHSQVRAELSHPLVSREEIEVGWE